MKRIKLTRIVAGICLSLIISGASASPVETIETNTYTINPRTQYDILRELNAYSPIRKNGVTYHGNTDWNVIWRFQLQPVTAGCSLSAIKTRVEITYTLPILNKDIRNGNTIRRFNTYKQALVRHEHNHGLNGVKAAQEIDRRLHELKPAPSCRQQEKIANDIGHRIILKYAAMDTEYDRITRHGRTEGAFIN